MLTPALTVSRSTVVEKERELSAPGSITVSPGDVVTSDQVIGRASRPGDLHVLRVAEKLGVSPAEAAACVRVVPGIAVARGEVVALHRGVFGLFTTEYRSPVEGTAESIVTETGHVTVRGPAVTSELTAYIAGTVTSVTPGKSAVIRTTAALVQGVFGIGGERTGVVRALGVPPGEKLRESHVPEGSAGTILVGGTRPDARFLRAAGAAGVRGVVVGSVDDAALAEYLGYDLGIALTGDERIPLSMFVTEGFGELALSERVIDLARESDGRAASMNGTTQVRAGAVRPELVIPTDREASSAAAIPVLEVGADVRLIRAPYFGLRGTVTGLPHAPAKIATGAVTRVASVRLDDGREVSVPRANLELIGS